MRFPWHKYEEIPVSRRNTLQVFITNRCNMSCEQCFARHAMAESPHADMDIAQYARVLANALDRGVQQINLLGGEPLMHPKVYDFITMNKLAGLKTTLYTNGSLLSRIDPRKLQGAKLRVSIYSLEDQKGINLIESYDPDIEFDANFMTSSTTTVVEMLEVADVAERVHGCRVFFIFSMRECDNPAQEFFCDTEATGTTFGYKQLVHTFLEKYRGAMDIHVSKRGVFESTLQLPCKRCNFANVFPGGKIIQCPFDVVNLVWQPDYMFGVRDCQQNSTCLMSKVVYRPIR